MSIINEALRKTQQLRNVDKSKREKVAPKVESVATPKPVTAQPVESRVVENKRETVAPRRPQVVKKSDFIFTWKMVGVLTLAAVSAVIVLNNQHRLLATTPLYAENTAAAAVSPPANAKTKVAFEGVFLSDNTKIALINKQSMHVGDMINGMRIVAINQDTVDLQDAKGTIELKAGATYVI